MGKIRRWTVKCPYVWQGQRVLYKFNVEARDRVEAALLAHAVIREKCPIEPDFKQVKMTRLY